MSIVLNVHPGVQLDTLVDKKKKERKNRAVLADLSITLCADWSERNE